MGRGAGNIIVKSTVAKAPVEPSRNMNGRELNIAHNVRSGRGGAGNLISVPEGQECTVAIKDANDLLDKERAVIAARRAAEAEGTPVKSGRGGYGNIGSTFSTLSASAAQSKEAIELRNLENGAFSSVIRTLI